MLPFAIVGFNPKTTSHCIYRVRRKFLSPTKIPSISACFSHILRGETFLLFSCLAPFQNKSGTAELDTGPNTEESKPEGRLTRGRACRKLGGAGSSPKSTSIVETLRDFSIAYRHHPVKQQRARMPVGRKISNSTPFSSRQNGTAAEFNMLTGINSYRRPR